MSEITNSSVYFETLESLKREIIQARLRAHLAVNKELILLYWRMGREILRRQTDLGWGAKVIDQLSCDLRHEFPDIKGFGVANLHNMRRFAGLYPNEEFLQQAAGELPWYHHVLLMERVKNPEERQFYIQETIKNGWSRNVLALQIDVKLYERQGKALTNFKYTLPKTDSDLAQQIFKNEYNLEFLGLTKEVQERKLERKLIDHIRDFLLELGSGFSFMGCQYKLTVGGDDFYVDMLFYHVKLRCYVVIELKTGKFHPNYLGQLEFYLTVIDTDIKHPLDQPTIGLLLCQEANKLVVEYALKEKKQPMGVSKYILSQNALPKGLEDALPSPEQFEHLLKTLNKEGDG